MLFFRTPAHRLSRQFILPVLLLAIFCIQYGLSLSDLPTTKILQDIICLGSGAVTDTLKPGFVPESLCHDELVQTRLSLVSIGLAVSQTVGSTAFPVLYCFGEIHSLTTTTPQVILAAVPFGSLADRLGRVPVLLIVSLGMLAMQAYILGVLRSWEDVSVEALWASGVFLLIGGGRVVAEAVVFTIIADISPEAKRSVPSP